jgi:hypothetical protein
MKTIFSFLYNLIIYLPVILLAIGIIISIISWKKHSLLSLLSIIAFIIQIFIIQIAPYVFDWLRNDLLPGLKISPIYWMDYYMGWYVLRSIINTISWILLFIIIFVEKKKVETKSF